LYKCLTLILTGRRPVSLIGFSFGARVIYKCLKEIGRHQREWLKKKENDSNLREPASIIEDVILMGLPNHYNRDTWCDMRSVVNGRLVNCYSKNDWILQIMFQLKKISVKPVCVSNEFFFTPTLKSGNLLILISSTCVHRGRYL